LGGKKASFENRLIALDKAQEAGLDDVGIGVLFGLYDWRYEVLALVRHTCHLEACYNVGPHTISFPRIKDASGLEVGSKYFVSDKDFAKLVAILRLAVPYTGMILTAREPEALRDEIIQYGVSQIDGGTKIEIGAYSRTLNQEQNLNKGQFMINDERSLSEIINELLDKEMIPSFCTACYRLGRTGEHFMEFSVPGFIKKYCTPNATLTLAEYITDYADEATAEKGWKVIQKTVDEIENKKLKVSLEKRLERVKAGERDLNYWVKESEIFRSTIFSKLGKQHGQRQGQQTAHWYLRKKKCREELFYQCPDRTGCSHSIRHCRNHHRSR
jgi:2-iminoacetate synthase